MERKAAVMHGSVSSLLPEAPGTFSAFAKGQIGKFSRRQNPQASVNIEHERERVCTGHNSTREGPQGPDWSHSASASTSGSVLEVCPSRGRTIKR